MRGIMRRAVQSFSIRSRRKKAARICAFASAHGVRSVVMAGAVGIATRPNENIVEAQLAAQVERVTGFNLDATAGLAPWPVVIADGRRMPYADKSVDLVMSNAVVEHVGGEAEQRVFIEEHVRVGRTWVITTPNRWFPVEAHTAAILRHWSTPWRDRRREFTRLLSRREFVAMLPPGSHVVGAPWSATFTAYSS